MDAEVAGLLRNAACCFLVLAALSSNLRVCFVQEARFLGDGWRFPCPVVKAGFDFRTLARARSKIFLSRTLVGMPVSSR